MGRSGSSSRRRAVERVAQRRADVAELGPQRFEQQLARGEQPARVGDGPVEPGAIARRGRGPRQLAPGLPKIARATSSPPRAASATSRANPAITATGSGAS